MVGSCGGCERDVVAEGLELADQVAGLAVGVEAFGVVVRAEVHVVGGGIVEEMPDDHQDRACHGDEGSLLASPSHEPPVTFTRNVSVLAAAVAASPRTPLR